MTFDPIRVSKFLSLVLRHEPTRAGIMLDAAGWVAVDDLLRGCAKAGHALTRAQLDELVRQSDKQRFALSPDGQRIRANQGHSAEVNLEYAPQIPPPRLYHGTATRFLRSIQETGLRKGQRHHVHLSADTATAFKVGQRHGKAIVVEVAADAMHSAGIEFFRSTNGVWLTESVPPQYLTQTVDPA